MLGINGRIAWAITALSLMCSPAGAADLSKSKTVSKEATAPASPWQFQFTPYAWLLFVNGDVKLGDNTAGVNTNIFEILNKSDEIYAWMSYQELRNGPFTFYANVVWARMGFSDTKSGVFPIGPLNTSVGLVADGKVRLDLAIIEPGVTLEVAKWSGAASSKDGKTFVPVTALDLVVGARYWYIRPDVNVNVTATVNIPSLGLSRTGAGNVSAAKTIDWLDPLVGLRLRYAAAPGQDLVLQGDVGGFGVGSKFTWQALAAYNHNMQLAGLNFTGQLGYRAISVDYEEESGERAIGLNYIAHGPIIGFTFRW